MIDTTGLPTVIVVRGMGCETHSRRDDRYVPMLRDLAACIAEARRHDPVDVRLPGVSKRTWRTGRAPVVEHVAATATDVRFSVAAISEDERRLAPSVDFVAGSGRVDDALGLIGPETVPLLLSVLLTAADVLEGVPSLSMADMRDAVRAGMHQVMTIEGDGPARRRRETDAMGHVCESATPFGATAMHWYDVFDSRRRMEAPMLPPIVVMRRRFNQRVEFSPAVIEIDADDAVDPMRSLRSLAALADHLARNAR